MIPLHKKNKSNQTCKNIQRKIHDCKNDVGRTEMQRIYICLCGLLVVLIIYSVYNHIIPLSLWLPITSNQSLQSNITSNNDTLLLNKNEDIDNELGINFQNLSQINLFHFIKHWGEVDVPIEPTQMNKTLNKSLNIWTKNISRKPPLKIPKTALDDIEISNVVWDFGACGCSGWGIG